MFGMLDRNQEGHVLNLCQGSIHIHIADGGNGPHMEGAEGGRGTQRLIVPQS